MPARYLELIQSVRALAAREADAIATAFPKVQRRVGGYNLDRVHPSGHNMAQLLVGSEGTLALFRRLLLRLQPLPRHRVLGVCHFPTFHDAMASTQAIVELAPSAVELVDRTIIELGRQIPAYRPLIERFVRGAPDALLLVEFAGDEADEQRTQLQRLSELMADLGFPRGRGRGDRARGAGPDLGRAQGRAQHRHVDEGRRQAGLVHRGLRGAARAPRRLHARA